MVKLYKSLRDGGGSPTTGTDCLTISGYSNFKGYRRKRLGRIEVVKMLSPRRSTASGADGPNTGNATMASQNYDDEVGTKEFLSTGRTGRRNALPDILSRHASTNIADLPDRFGELSTSAGRGNGDKHDPNQASTSTQQVG